MPTVLSRKFRVDVTADLTLASGWLQLNGINDFKADDSPNLVDTSAYDTNGSGSFEKTFEDWTAAVTVFRRTDGAGVYDPAQELVRAATVGQFGNACRVGLRWYDKNGGPEAYKGIAIVQWARANSGVKDVDAATITFTGTDLPLAAITNPGVAPVAPVVLSATPSGAAAGAQVTITGTGFTGVVPATGVKFAAVTATVAVVLSDNTIVAVMPAGSAGSAPVTVTNTVGVSNALAYTRA